MRALQRRHLTWLADRTFRVRAVWASARLTRPRVFLLAVAAVPVAGLAATAAVVLAGGRHHTGVSAPMPRVAASTHTAARPLPHAARAVTANARATACQQAARALQRTAHDYPKYKQLPPNVSRRTQSNLDTVGQLCDEATAKLTMTTLDSWLRGH